MVENNKTHTAVSQSKGANLDHVSCGCGVIYLVGWALNGRDGCNTIEVFFHKNGLHEPLLVPIVLQKRPDVIKHFSLPEESLVGFSVQVSLSNYDISSLPPGQYTVVIRATGSDHSIFEKNVGAINIIWPANIQSIGSSREARKSWAPKRQGLLQKIWYGRLGSDEMAREIYYKTEVTTGNIIEATHMISSGNPMATVISDSPTLKIASLLKSASNNNGLIVILDHNFGGGANVFSKQTIDNSCHNHNVILRVWYDPNISKLSGAVYYNSERCNISVGEINILFQLLVLFPSHCLQINNLYTWPYIESVLDNIVRLRIFNYTKRLEFFGHDHIGICPSMFLLNENGIYCGVPENVNICQNCLQRNSDSFKVFYKQEDVTAWREAWRSVLLNSDYIRFFSQATYNEYIKAFPSLTKSLNVVVKGHKVKALGNNKVEKSEVDGITRIGIFGFLGPHKGSRVVLQLAESISNKNLPIQIHVFGTIDGISKANRGALTIHGPYDCMNMVKIWNENHLDFSFVPSICPETFSLVTAELLNIKAKVVTFNLGAQAELVNKHDLAMVIPLPHEKPVLNSILDVINIWK
ncbi:MAG: hypothetical protein L3J75_16485 [Methylococcaceae bacterium]|nr:hypothetical protein [Methylococcaceae bacterium]